MKPSKKLFIIGMIFLISSQIAAFNLEHHMYLGAFDPQIWENFDPGFGNYLSSCLSWPPADTLRMLTAKFYLIGLTLPDLLIPSRQEAVRRMITQLYPYASQIPFSACPCRIHQSTYENVQREISFRGPFPNENFPKLREMAEHAKYSGWTPYEKSLIYGAYAHVMQDLYAGTVFIPSRFGYGFAIDSDSAINKPILYYGGAYYELFSGTHINSWQFIRHLFSALKDRGGGNYEFPAGAGQFYWRSDVAGGNPRGWQDLDFLPVQRFCEAAQAREYGDPSTGLTQERLESYLHGWSFPLFFIYGYARDGQGRPIDIGGITAHPDWNFPRILQFWDNVSDELWTLRVIKQLLKESEYFRNIVGELMKEIFGAPLHEWEELLELVQPWPDYLKQPGYLEDFYEALPPRIREALAREKRLAYENLRFWNEYARIKPPWSPDSYSEEIQSSLTFSPLYKTTLLRGPSDLNHNMYEIDAVTLAKKAGLTGGMYNPESDIYVRQPGVIFLRFEKDGWWKWSNFEAYNGDPEQSIINLYYDLICFGPTKLYLKGKREDGSEFVLGWKDFNLGRQKGTIDVSVKNAYLAGARKLFWEVWTRDIYSQNYKLMLRSHYEETYADNQCIQENALYQNWFCGGRSWREELERPFQDPLRYWPYTLRVSYNDQVYKLNPPKSLRANPGISQIWLIWRDDSDFEDEYEIARRCLETGERRSFRISSGGPGRNDINWLDNNDIQAGYTYEYKVRAWRVSQFSSNFSNTISATILHSTKFPLTAYNNSPKITPYGSNMIHATFHCEVSNDRSIVKYIFSSDRGITWQTENVTEVNGYLPAIALDEQGNPFIVFSTDWSYHTQGNPPPQKAWYQAAIVFAKRDENGNWNARDLATITIPSVWPPPPPPSFRLLQSSFCIRGDVGYIAFRSAVWGDESYTPRITVKEFNKSTGDGMEIAWLTPVDETYSTPTLLVDRDNRIVVCYAHSDEGKIYIHYKEPNENNFRRLSFTTSQPRNLNAQLLNGRDILLSWEEGICVLRYAKLTKAGPDTGYQIPQQFETIFDEGHQEIVSWIVKDGVVLYHHLELNDNARIYYALKTFGGWRSYEISFPGPFTSHLYPQGVLIPHFKRVFQTMKVYWTGVVDNRYYVLTKDIVLPLWEVYCDRATAPNQGELLTIEPGTGNLHMVYNKDSTIVYAKSMDKGETWESIMEVDSGSYPSLALDNTGMPRITYLKNDTVFCQTLLTDNTWHKTVIFGYDGNRKPGPPVIAQTFIPTLSNYSYCVFPIKNLTENTSNIGLSIFDANQDISPEPEEIASGVGLKSPSIAITPGDIIHIVWEEAGEIYYRFSEGKDSTGEFVWSDIYNISESPDVISENPVIEAYGENVICAWKEGEPGEIYRRIRLLSESSFPTWPPGWSGIENISASPDRESDYPVLSTPDVCAYQEKIDSLNYEVIAWIRGSLVNISETENSSKYPHIAVEPPTASDASGAIVISPEVVINTIWTEAIIPDTLYEVRFQRYEYTSSSTAGTAYLSPVVGDSVASTYCEQRDGVINYGEFSVDYSSSSLIYNLPYFNPQATYLLRAVVYKETPRQWREEVYIDSNFITEVFYYPYIPETLNIILPKETYENDLAIRKEIERIIGSYALLADLKVYEVSIPESLQGGGQSLRSEKITRPALYQNRPNPFKGLTKISFLIPRECFVSLLIYDVSGRKARTLISEKLKPGNYNLKWDGKDDRGRDLPQGVYFYRLKAEDFKDIKKTVLLR